MKSRKIVLIRLFVGQDREADIENKLVDIYVCVGVCVCVCVCVLCKGLPGGSDGQESICNAEDLSLIPWRRKWQPTPVLLPGESHRQRSLADYSPWVAKSQTRLSD